jgi:hypothetical protein
MLVKKTGHPNRYKRLVSGGYIYSLWNAMMIQAVTIARGRANDHFKLSRPHSFQKHCGNINSLLVRNWFGERSKNVITLRKKQVEKKPGPFVKYEICFIVENSIRNRLQNPKLMK